jgi:protein SHQ1
MQILDIIFSILYEFRCMDGDFSSESATTINLLSSTLSCHCIDSEPENVILTSFRRALTYPIYRNF